MELELERGLEQIFQKFWSKLLLILILCFLCFPFIFDGERIIFSSPICAFNETKITQFGLRNEENIGKCSVTGNVLNDRQFYPTLGLVHTDQVFLTLSLASCPQVVVAGHLPSQGGKGAH
jgi:hypothetical protein